MPSNGSRPEYHHYIPQFILRNFSHPYSPLQGGSKSGKRRSKKDPKTGAYPGDAILNIVDLKDDEPRLSESLTKRTFGLLDMYADNSNSNDRRYVETELGKLENRASTIIATIKKALESGQAGVKLPRSERDILRKFLFIMKYRGTAFHRRFHGDEHEHYVADDKEKFIKYMQDNGYTNPVDVWFKSIKAILDLQIDVKRKWIKKLLEEIYPDDAMWFFMHMEMHFLALCTPSEPTDEFILTENCYNVHEGPHSTALNPDTGDYEITAWTSFHEFGLISPKLLLVLRSFLLPNAEEDADQAIKEWRRTMYELSSLSHIDPSTAKSILEDLPLRKPRNSYSQFTGSGLRYLSGEDGSRRQNHTFTFPFFKIGTTHVLKINALLLDNAHLTSTIAYNTKLFLKDSIQYYLQLPAHGFKAVQNQPNDPRLMYLKKLQSILRTLGSTVEAVYKANPSVKDYENLTKEFWDKLREMKGKMTDYLRKRPVDTEFMQLYKRLGGTADTISYDLDQAGRMRSLRIKVDVCTQRLDETIRQDVRDKLRDLYSQFEPRRVWLYLKEYRAMSLGTPGSLAELEVDDGPEDVIVKASHVVRKGDLPRLLYFTVMKDLTCRRNPGLHPGADFTLDEAGARRLHLITDFTFSLVGSIRDCGIDCIESRAKSSWIMLRMSEACRTQRNPVWTDEENIEILTRVLVRQDMDALLAGQLDGETLKELKDVLFNIVYPTYPEER